MAKYRYKAKNLEGKIVRGITEAENDTEFYRYLEKQQLYCIDVQGGIREGITDRPRIR